MKELQTNGLWRVSILVRLSEYRASLQGLQPAMPTLKRRTMDSFKPPHTFLLLIAFPFSPRLLLPFLFHLSLILASPSPSRVYSAFLRPLSTSWFSLSLLLQFSQSILFAVAYHHLEHLLISRFLRFKLIQSTSLFHLHLSICYLRLSIDFRSSSSRPCSLSSISTPPSRLIFQEHHHHHNEVPLCSRFGFCRLHLRRLGWSRRFGCYPSWSRSIQPWCSFRHHRSQDSIPRSPLAQAAPPCRPRSHGP